VRESSLSFFLQEKGVHLGLVVEGEEGRPGKEKQDPDVLSLGGGRASRTCC
jgi:hypothetical protein